VITIFAPLYISITHVTVCACHTELKGYLFTYFRVVELVGYPSTF